VSMAKRITPQDHMSAWKPDAEADVAVAALFVAPAAPWPGSEAWPREVLPGAPLIFLAAEGPRGGRAVACTFTPGAAATGGAAGGLAMVMPLL
jgi:hypothetical protein